MSHQCHAVGRRYNRPHSQRTIHHTAQHYTKHPSSHINLPSLTEAIYGRRIYVTGHRSRARGEKLTADSRGPVKYFNGLLFYCLTYSGRERVSVF